MILVLDASAALGIALGREDARHSREAVAEAEVVIAPDLFVAETVNAVWKYARLGHLSSSAAQRMLATALAMVDTLVPMEDQAQECLTEALRTNHPAYDLMYLTLARRRGAVLATRDRRMIVLATELGIPTT